MSVEDLRVAALEGDLKRVQEILKKGKVDINKNFFFFWTGTIPRRKIFAYIFSLSIPR